MADRRSAIPNPVLRQVRVDEFQMSRMEFAAEVRKAGKEMGEPVGCRARLVAAWEDGEVGCPRGVYRRIDPDPDDRPQHGPAGLPHRPDCGQRDMRAAVGE